MRLLIVEDEKELCDTIAKTLYQAGYEVDTCYDGDEALDYILAENYDLIVLDLESARHRWYGYSKRTPKGKRRNKGSHFICKKPDYG